MEGENLIDTSSITVASFEWLGLRRQRERWKGLGFCLSATLFVTPLVISLSPLSRPNRKDLLDGFVWGKEIAPYSVSLVRLFGHFSYLCELNAGEGNIIKRMD